jgi:hypothetical protein
MRMPRSKTMNVVFDRNRVKSVDLTPVTNDLRLDFQPTVVGAALSVVGGRVVTPTPTTGKTEAGESASQQFAADKK